MNELPQIDLRQILQSAVVAYRAGDLNGVERTCRAVLDQYPEQPDALNLLGMTLHRSSRSDEAIPLLQRAAAASPGAPSIRVNLGNVLRAVGRPADAEASLRAALDLGPNDASVYIHLGSALREQGKTEEAIQILAAACNLEPEAWRIRKQLAGLLLDAERYEDAVTQYQKSLAHEPSDPDLLNNLGFAIEKLGRMDEAKARFKAGLAIDPGHVPLLGNLGVCLIRQNQFGEAEACFRKALKIAPDTWQMAQHLSEVLVAMGSFEEAVEILRPLHRDRPDDPAVTSRLAFALYFNGDVDESRRVAQLGLAANSDDPGLNEILAVDDMGRGDFVTAEIRYEKITAADPSNVQALAGLAQVKNMLGKADEACLLARTAVAHPYFSGNALPACLDILLSACDFEAISQMGDIIGKAESMRPDLFWGGFLMVVVLAETQEARQGLFRLHRRWGEHAELLAARDPLPPVGRRKREGKLRIGILSSDLHAHAVTKFLMPIIRHYDRERIQLHCYCTRTTGDDPIQKEISETVDGFVRCDAMSSRAIAETIRTDEIDALVELNGHTRNSQLATFAYRAAPIQVEWLGYPYTSGLKDADYVLVDPFLKPEADELMTEKPLVMPETAYCFDAMADIEIDFPAPFERNGHVTFGTMGNPYKFTPSVVAAWSKAMRTVPGSRFLLVRPGIDSSTFASNLGAAFDRHGIESDRLTFLDNGNSDRPHYSFYNDMDICLDTFPLTGGTTTCDALWMGVPVVSLYGASLYERISYTILSQLGLSELCVRSVDDYVETAAALARDGERLRRYRRSLRTRMQDSALCQGERFVRNFENVLIEAASSGKMSTFAA